jgi:cytochrome b561
MQEAVFQDKYALSLRIWHWLTFIVVTILIITVLVNDTVLNEETAPAVITRAATEKAVVLNKDQAAAILEPLRETVWEWHTYLGYALGVLFLFRIAAEFFQPAEEKLIAKVKRGITLAKNSNNRKEGRHYLFVKILYTGFYILLTGIVITGLWLAFFKEDNTFSKETIAAIKELHENFYNILLVFLFLHLAGVLRAELGKDKNLISRMINGGKQ